MTTKSILIEREASIVSKKISTWIIPTIRVIWSLKELKKRWDGLLKLKNSKNKKEEGLKCEKLDKIINNHLRPKLKKNRPIWINGKKNYRAVDWIEMKTELTSSQLNLNRISIDIWYRTRHYSSFLSKSLTFLYILSIINFAKE